MGLLTVGGIGRPGRIVSSGNYTDLLVDNEYGRSNALAKFTKILNHTLEIVQQHAQRATNGVHRSRLAVQASYVHQGSRLTCAKDRSDGSYACQMNNAPNQNE